MSTYHSSGKLTTNEIVLGSLTMQYIRKPESVSYIMRIKINEPYLTDVALSHFPSSEQELINSAVNLSWLHYYVNDKRPCNCSVNLNPAKRTWTHRFLLSKWNINRIHSQSYTNVFTSTTNVTIHGNMEHLHDKIRLPSTIRPRTFLGNTNYLLFLSNADHHWNNWLRKQQ